MEDLRTMQAWPLERKIQVTQTRIMEWYMRWQGKVYVSFSGGKDSTVLLDLARRIYPDIEAVFLDTGLEYPEIREFVKTKDNVRWLHPVKYNRKTKKYERYSFYNVIRDYGYPVVSKVVSDTVKGSHKNGSTRWQNINGLRTNSDGGKSQYCCENWKFLLDAPFKISDMCCDKMKKIPAKLYEHETGNHPMTAMMADEDKQRRRDYMATGCNAFNLKRPQSQPMGFWTEQDVLRYICTYLEPEIKKRWSEAKFAHGSIRRKAQKHLRRTNYVKTALASVYGHIVENENGKLKTIGEQRTGCMFCMFGCHLEKEPNRFQRMKETHPKQYEYCMKDVEVGGLGLRNVLDYMNVPYE